MRRVLFVVALVLAAVVSTGFDVQAVPPTDPTQFVTKDFPPFIAWGDVTFKKDVTVNGALNLSSAPDAGGALVGTLDAADSLFMSGQDLKYEGTTVDGFESMIRFAADPTQDQILVIPNASGYPILSTTDVQAADSIFGGSSSLIFEGATADTNELTLTVQDPAADVTATIPAATGTLLVFVGSGAAPGATCKVGEVYVDTDANNDTNCATTLTNALCVCTSSNTWLGN